MSKKKRNTAPILVDTQGRTRKLESARGVWSEGQLQEFLYEHPDVLPVERIEPFFAPLVPLAREVRLESGRLDLLYANACRRLFNPLVDRQSQIFLIVLRMLH